jgi:hypothetical protein
MNMSISKVNVSKINNNSSTKNIFAVLLQIFNVMYFVTHVNINAAIFVYSAYPISIKSKFLRNVTVLQEKQYLFFFIFINN